MLIAKHPLPGFFEQIHKLKQDKILFLMLTYATLKPVKTFRPARRENDISSTKKIS